MINPMIQKIFRFNSLFTKKGWMDDVFVAVDKNGLILAISENDHVLFNNEENIPIESVDGFALPGFQNAHSHAFQYAMAGVAEHYPELAQEDDFWTWREAMYSLASRITPDEMEAIASLLYAEMLRYGITSVTEFHYIHNDTTGNPYSYPAEMGERLVEAAKTSGIHITLVPVMYENGGFGQPLKKGQIRFRTFGLDGYEKILESSKKAVKGWMDANLGVGIHSLRAVSVDDAFALLSNPPKGPIHLHVAEQRREVEDCIAHLKKRPVRWILDNVTPDHRFNLVHATHMTEDEARDLGKSGATVILCPSTEGNLGDGIFSLDFYRKNGGGCAIGSDSQIGLSPFEELRWIDYVQRLKKEKRNIVCSHGGDDSGTLLLSEAWERGRKAMGLPHEDFFAIGAPLDAVIVDPNHPILISKSKDRRIGAIVYGGDASILKGTMRRGEWLVKDGHHARIAKIKSNYKEKLKNLWI